MGVNSLDAGLTGSIPQGRGGANALGAAASKGIPQGPGSIPKIGSSIPQGRGQNLAPGAKAGKVAQCALVLEDNPVGADSRLEFETFDTGLEEGYAVTSYKELAGERMPQPGYVNYRGGDWQPFNLKLMFYAGTALASGTGVSQASGPSAYDAADIENILIEMESKVRWCQALTFPLERSAGSIGKRVLARANTANVEASAAATEAVGKLRRNDPPFVLIVFGSWMVIRGYVLNTSIKWKEPFHPVSARPYGAEVDISFKPSLIEYPTWDTIRNRAGQGGLTTALASRGDTSLAEALAAQLAQAQGALRNDPNNAFARAQVSHIQVTQATLAAGLRATDTKRATDNAAAITKLQSQRPRITLPGFAGAGG